MDCTLCMDCVKACPHDNIGLFAVAPVRDVLRDPVRSSIGRFSARIDIAVLVLVVVVAAFVNAGCDGGPRPWENTWRWRSFSRGGDGPAVAGQPIKKRNSFAASPRRCCLWDWRCGLPICCFTCSPAGQRWLPRSIRPEPTWPAPSRASSMGKEQPLLPANRCSRYNFCCWMPASTDPVPGVETRAQWAASAGRAVLLMLPWASVVTLGYAQGCGSCSNPCRCAAS